MAGLLLPAELSYPKPNVSLHPSKRVTLGGAVTVRCECQCPGARVLLYKAGAVGVWRATDSAGDVVEFLIRNVSRRDAGSYSCQYSTKSDPPVWSEPSDPMELVVTAAPPGHPDFNHANITRLALGAVVLLVLGLILAEAYYSRPRGTP
ncbi:T-cell-interacting, activating receptor on myeloid cells protein 1-like [Malaclemys terrapin pileata]|uniref:T-cell-interacting, activating receptor on myeloid cells protein 1-like n=1 Tax=Malaclemys terrapin pileata TaxID=2991368 RepID=UPI0023A8143C|nr:T-cell-interacting, activating receptor on myeloid cells protein 1-like [Malaclemys terrapin pileata]